MTARRVLLREWEARAFAAGRASALLRPVMPQPVPFGELDTAGMAPALADAPWMPIGGTDKSRWRCPLGRPGDELWGAEAWSPRVQHGCRFDDVCECDTVEVVYQVDGRMNTEPLRVPDSWTLPKTEACSSATMPRWASRFAWRVADVRCVRVCSSMLGRDVLALGVTSWSGMVARWNADYGKAHPWDANPWAWFVRVEVAS